LEIAKMPKEDSVVIELCRKVRDRRKARRKKGCVKWDDMARASVSELRENWHADDLRRFCQIAHIKSEGTKRVLIGAIRRWGSGRQSFQEYVRPQWRFECEQSGQEWRAGQIGVPSAARVAVSAPERIGVVVRSDRPGIDLGRMTFSPAEHVVDIMTRIAENSDMTRGQQILEFGGRIINPWLPLACLEMESGVDSRNIVKLTMRSLQSELRGRIWYCSKCWRHVPPKVAGFRVCDVATGKPVCAHRICPRTECMFENLNATSCPVCGKSGFVYHHV